MVVFIENKVTAIFLNHIFFPRFKNVKALEAKKLAILFTKILKGIFIILGQNVPKENNKEATSFEVAS